MLEPTNYETDYSYIVINVINLSTMTQRYSKDESKTFNQSIFSLGDFGRLVTENTIFRMFRELKKSRCISQITRCSHFQKYQPPTQRSYEKIVFFPEYIRIRTCRYLHLLDHLQFTI